MKILLVNPYDLTHPGGVTNHVFDLAEQFRLMGHEADIIGPAGQGLLPQNGYTHSVGHTMRFITPGDRARINLSPFVYQAVEKFLHNREYDVYHMQRMEGNVTATIREHIGRIGHIQVADSPGRNQPGTGELNYRFVFETIAASGYAGMIGAEYNPRGSSEASLAWLPADRRAGIAVEQLRL